ncbi:MAG: transglutaminase domain-containing protein [Clostridia bacterium]|nr:transglutaminase domain-containing protein [Clostridia bacterium]
MTDSHQTFDPARSEFMTYPKGRYQRYEERIGQISAILGFLRKHKLLILSALAVLIAALLTFLFCIGLFTQELTCRDYTYGQQNPYSAKAFLASVDYQFAEDADDPQWENAFPTVPGDYLVRGVTRNPFGMERYSAAVAFTVSPRKLEITLSSATCTYGDLTDRYLESLTRVKGLARGDKLTDLQFTCSGEEWSRQTVSISSFRVTNKEGKDVTAFYLPTTKEAVLTVTPRKITFQAPIAEKIYDGKPVTDLSATVIEGSLAKGDRLKSEFHDYPAMAGNHQIIVKHHKIVNKMGYDVTDRYDATWLDGYVNVLPRPITVTSGSAEKVYDDAPLTAPQWSLTQGTLVEGEQLTVTVSGTRTIVGESDNTLKVAVIDGQGNDLSKNYKITLREGKLTVKPIILKFTTDSAEKVYDGTALVANGYRLVEGSVLPHHQLVCKTTGSQTSAGVGKNTLSVDILDANGRYVNGNGYQTVVEEGSLTVTKRPITVTSESAEKVYDGKVLVHKVMQLTKGSLADKQFPVSYFTGSQTDAGESDNVFTVRITNEKGADFTSNYDITYEYGKLTVTRRPITVTSGSRTKIYDGKPLVCQTSQVTKGSLADTDRMRVNYTGSQTEIGESDNTFLVSIMLKTDSGHLTTANYDITYVCGTLKVVPGTPDDDPVNGGEQGGESPDSTIIDYPSPPSSDVIASIHFSGIGAIPHTAYLRSKSYGDYTGKGFGAAEEYVDSDLSPLDYVARNALHMDAPLYNFKITRKAGCPLLIPYFSYDTALQFGNGDVGFTSDLLTYVCPIVRIESIKEFQQLKEWADEIEYRRFVYDQYLQIPDTTRDALLQIAKEQGILETTDVYTLIFQIQAYIQSAATYNLSGTPYPDDVDDVVVYFLTEAKEGICQHFASAGTMMYRAFGIPARYVVGYVADAVPDQTTNVTADKAHAWVEIYLDGIGWVPVEVTGGGGFNGGINDGEPETPPELIELWIASYSANKIYDGKPFGEWIGDKVNLIKGQLLPGHTMQVTVNESGKNAVNVGTYYNKITEVVILDEAGNDVTAQYSILYREGSMTIQARPITIQLGSAEKVYDGKPLTCDTWNIVSGNLLENHWLTLKNISSTTTVGTVDNTAKSVSIQSTDPSGKREYVTNNYDITILPGTLTVLPE